MEIHKIHIPRDTLLEEIERGVLVITGNERLSRDLVSGHEQRRIAAGSLAWETPLILSWNQWISRCWEENILAGAFEQTPILLSPLQENALWEKVVSESETGGGLLQLVPTIRQVRDAWKMLHEWQLDLDEARPWQNEDSLAFSAWVDAFRRILTSRRYLTSVQLADVLRAQVLQGHMIGQGRIILIGFDELTPQQQALLQAMQQQGVDIRWCENPSRNHQVRQVAAANVRAEAYLAARWTRYHLEQNPEQRICIVVPELEKQRKLLVQVFDEILCPEKPLPGQEHRERPYNISVGLPLSRYAPIQIALLLLSSTPASLPVEEVGQWLHSPFIEGWEAEIAARSLLQNRVREDAELCVSVQRLIAYANEADKPWHCPILAGLLVEWKNRLETLPRRQSVDQWVDVLFQLLQLAGWAKGRSLSSEEFQVVSAWNELLPTLVSLDPVIGAVSYQRMLQELRRLVNERLFQPRTGQSRIQIMGVWETSGLEFDRLWLMGLHDGIWPPPAQPHPFIPLRLQWKKRVPHSSASREVEVVGRTTHRLIESATEVMLSYPCMSEQEELRPSALITPYECIDADALPVWPGKTWKYLIHESGALEVLSEDPVPPADPASIRGGSRVFRLQALCPFRAFAEIRLGARKPGIPTLGLDPMKRGILVHRVLERVWSELKSQQRLLALSTEERISLLNAWIEQVLKDSERDSPYTFTKKFREVEQARILALMTEWLACEEQRAPFQVVACEKRIEQEIAGIPVRLSIDRVDELEDGRKIVIDYKTGEVTPAQWFGDRPEEPQLPLYASVIEQPLAAVSFAQLKQGKLGFNGVAEQADLIKGVKEFKKLKPARDFPDWSSLLQEWQRVIEHLGAEFRSGHAKVSPKDRNTTCQYCDMELLCRVFEVSDQEADEGESE